jgi:hypothetical protein
MHLDEHQISPPSTVVPVVLPDPGCIYEIWLSGLDQMELSDLDEIAEDIDDELSDHDAGEVIGTGGMVGEDQQNIAVQSAPGKNQQALACIRRVLKSLKANPETTDIYVQGQDDVTMSI